MAYVDNEILEGWIARYLENGDCAEEVWTAALAISRGVMMRFHRWARDDGVETDAVIHIIKGLGTWDRSRGTAFQWMTTVANNAFMFAWRARANRREVSWDFDVGGVPANTISASNHHAHKPPPKRTQPVGKLGPQPEHAQSGWEIV